MVPLSARRCLRKNVPHHTVPMVRTAKRGLRRGIVRAELRLQRRPLQLTQPWCRCHAKAAQQPNTMITKVSAELPSQQHTF